MDIHAKALALIRKHGDRAPTFAAMEADAMLEAGDRDGAATWRQVVRVSYSLPATVNRFRRVLERRHPLGDKTLCLCDLVGGHDFGNRRGFPSFSGRLTKR